MKTFMFFLKLAFKYFYWKKFFYINKSKILTYSVSPKSRIGKHVVIHQKNYIYGRIEIGDYSYISGPHTYVDSAVIGKFCSIARNVTIGPSNHDLSMISTHPFLYSPFYKIVDEYTKPSNNNPPIIGNDVWVGINSIILNNVKIGDGAIIGAGSIVTKDVEPYSVVGGVPAKHIKYRFEKEVIEKLLEIQWWNWSNKKMKKRVGDFNNVEKFLESE